ncbi:hypothetical protein D3C76_1304690 [compost metagenome]
MHAHAMAACQRHCPSMHRATVAEQHQVSDVQAAEHLGEPWLAVFGAARAVQGRAAGAIQRVADTETHAVHTLADAAQGVGQACEERRTDALQEQEVVSRDAQQRTTSRR